MVAFLNFKGVQGGPPYRAMYDSALKFLERDVRQEVAFAVVTSFKTTLELGGNRTPNIRLYLWNETLVLTSKYVIQQKFSSTPKQVTEVLKKYFSLGLQVCV